MTGEIITAICFVSLVIVVILSIFYRYILNTSLVWSDEFLRISLFWCVMLAAAQLSDTDGHFRIRLFHKFISLYLETILITLAEIISFFFWLTLLWLGLELTLASWGRTPVLQISQKSIYLAICVSSFFAIIFTSRRLMERLSGASGAHE